MRCALCAVRCALHPALALNPVLCTLYPVCALCYALHCVLCSVLCTLHGLLYPVPSHVLCLVSRVSYPVLCPAPCALYPCCALRPAPCTLHPAPCAMYVLQVWDKDQFTEDDCMGEV